MLNRLGVLDEVPRERKSSLWRSFSVDNAGQTPYVQRLVWSVGAAWLFAACVENVL